MIIEKPTNRRIEAILEKLFQCMKKTNVLLSNFVKRQEGKIIKRICSEIRSLMGLLFNKRGRVKTPPLVIIRIRLF